MALIKCKDCGQEVSDKASVCPNCGRPLGPGKNKVWIWALIAVLLCLVGAGIYYALNSSSNGGNETDVKEKTVGVADSVRVAEKEAVNKVEEKDTTVSAGLTLSTFTKKRKERGIDIQTYLGRDVVASNLKKLGFSLSNKVKERRLDYTGTEYYYATIETYSKTVNGRVTTVKLDEDFSSISFPGLNDVEEFKETVRAGGLKETKDGFEDREEIYYDGTNVSIKGKEVELSYKWEP